MKARTWWAENGVLVAGLSAVVVLGQLPHTRQTLGWVLGIFVAHSAHSHTLRKAEQAGKPVDWLSEVLVLLGGVAVLLAAEGPARMLVVVPVVRQALFVAWRFVWRRWLKPLPGAPWAREDD